MGFFMSENKVNDHALTDTAPTETEFFDWMRSKQDSKSLSQPMVDGAKALLPFVSTETLKSALTQINGWSSRAETVKTNDNLAWIDEAHQYVGLTEIKGSRHNKTITKWLQTLGAWWTDDETPWCGVFTAHCLTVAGRTIPKHWYRAKAYADYGMVLTRPAFGCLGVMSRTGGGHVCFVIGETTGDCLVVIGGNQSNQVSIATYPRSRFSHFVWPPHGNGVASLPYESRYELPRYAAGEYSQPLSEA